jgi:hypothetical protein
VRVDPSWGLSGEGRIKKGYNPYIRYATMDTTPDDYERCKAVHRCNRASTIYNQTQVSSRMRTLLSLMA